MLAYFSNKSTLFLHLEYPHFLSELVLTCVPSSDGAVFALCSCLVSVLLSYKWTLSDVTEMFESYLRAFGKHWLAGTFRSTAKWVRALVLDDGACWNTNLPVSAQLEPWAPLFACSDLLSTSLSTVSVLASMLKGLGLFWTVSLGKHIGGKVG